MPPLAESVPGFGRFTLAENASEAFALILRRPVGQVRRQQPHPFYSIREVAAYFGLAPSLVGRAGDWRRRCRA